MKWTSLTNETHVLKFTTTNSLILTKASGERWEVFYVARGVPRTIAKFSLSFDLQDAACAASILVGGWLEAKGHKELGIEVTEACNHGLPDLQTT